MTSLHDIQNSQLTLIESVYVSRSCAADLLSIMRKLTANEAKSVVDINQLQCQADKLDELSKTWTT